MMEMEKQIMWKVILTICCAASIVQAAFEHEGSTVRADLELTPGAVATQYRISLEELSGENSVAWKSELLENQGLFSQTAKLPVFGEGTQYVTNTVFRKDYYTDYTEEHEFFFPSFNADGSTYEIDNEFELPIVVKFRFKPENSVQCPSDNIGLKVVNKTLFKTNQGKTRTLLNRWVSENVQLDQLYFFRIHNSEQGNGNAWQTLSMQVKCGPSEWFNVNHNLLHNTQQFLVETEIDLGDLDFVIESPTADGASLNMSLGNFTSPIIDRGGNDILFSEVNNGVAIDFKNSAQANDVSGNPVVEIKFTDATINLGTILNRWYESEDGERAFISNSKENTTSNRDNVVQGSTGNNVALNPELSPDQRLLAQYTFENVNDYLVYGIRSYYQILNDDNEKLNWGFVEGRVSDVYEFPIDNTGEFQWGYYMPTQATLEVTEKYDVWNGNVTKTYGELEFTKALPPEDISIPAHKVSIDGDIPAGEPLMEYSVGTGKVAVVFHQREGLVFKNPIVVFKEVGSGSEGTKGYFTRQIEGNTGVVTAVMTPGVYDVMGYAYIDGLYTKFGDKEIEVKYNDEIILNLGKPIIELEQPTDTYCADGDAFQLKGIVDGQGLDIKVVEYAVNNLVGTTPDNLLVPGPLRPDIVHFDQTITYSGTDSEVLVKITAENEKGQTSSFSKTVYRDQTDPLLMVTPPDGIQKSNRYVITGNISDEEVPAKSLTINGGVVYGIAEDGSFEQDVLLVEGVNTFNIVATNQCGLSTETSIDVEYIPYYPVPRIDCEEAQYTAFNGMQMKLNGSESYAVSGKSLVDYIWNVGGILPEGVTTTYTVGNIQKQQLSLELTVADNEGVEASTGDFGGTCDIVVGRNIHYQGCNAHPKEICGGDEENLNGLDGVQFKQVFIQQNKNTLFLLIQLCELESFEGDQFIYMDLDELVGTGGNPTFETRFKIDFYHINDDRVPMIVTKEVWENGKWVVKSIFNQSDIEHRFGVSRENLKNPADELIAAGELIELKIPVPENRQSIRWYIDGSKYNFASEDEPVQTDVHKPNVQLNADGNPCDWGNNC